VSHKARSPVGPYFCIPQFIIIIIITIIIVILLLIPASAIEENFEGNRRRKITKGVLYLHDNAPAHRELATQKKLAYLGF
jgi:hypothetical protein